MSDFLDFNSAPRQSDGAGVAAPEWANRGPSRDEVHDALLAQLESVLGYLYPAGFADPKGKKFFIGSTHGEEGESLSVELTGRKAGLWHDFATGEGGDIFDLWRTARGLRTFAETLSDAGHFTGSAEAVPRRTPTRKHPKGGEAWGAPTATYNYEDANGNLLAQVDRFEWEEGNERKKVFRPWDVAQRAYRAPETRPLYGLPHVVRAPEVVLVEGEKAADALLAQNITATTAMGGANAPLEATDWTPLRGKMVVIWPDNDQAGKDYASRLKTHLESIGARTVSILTIPATRPEKWDAADAEGENLFALIGAMRTGEATPPRSSLFFVASDLAGILPPKREWHVDGLVPAHQVTMLGGDGGVGKSLLAFQLAIATASGTPWIDLKPAKTTAIYLSAEDDKDELHRRLDAICAVQNVPVSSLDNLILRSLAGEDALLAHADTRTGTLTPTPLFRELDEYLGDTGAGFLGLDTLADLHSGQENDRAVARQFIGLLRGLALRHSCTILLLAHPSLTGLASGTGLSGSTAWNNSVRSRLFFERIIEDGYEPDPDVRRLTTKKANYGKTGNEIITRWADGVFVPEGGKSPLGGDDRTMKARAVFMKLLRAYATEGRHVNANGGRHYAPAAFCKDSRAERVSQSRFMEAMNELFAAGAIRNEEWGPPSRRSTRIVEVSDG